MTKIVRLKSVSPFASFASPRCIFFFFAFNLCIYPCFIRVYPWLNLSQFLFGTGVVEVDGGRIGKMIEG